MRARSWRWLRTRVVALLDAPPTFVTYGELGARVAQVPATRLGFALTPPSFK